MFCDDSSSHGRSCKPCTTYSVSQPLSSLLLCPRVVQVPQEVIAAKGKRRGSQPFQRAAVILSTFVVVRCLSDLTPVVIQRRSSVSLQLTAWVQSPRLLGGPLRLHTAALEPSTWRPLRIFIFFHFVDKTSDPPRWRGDADGIATLDADSWKQKEATSSTPLICISNGTVAIKSLP